MNLNLNNNINEAYYEACNLTDKTFTHDELISMLKNGSVPQKQYAALSLNYIKDINEGEILIGNLTGCDGKIREAVALKINQLLIADSHSISPYIYPHPEIIADATIDINANICRLVIDSVSMLKQDKDFSEKYLNKILNFIDETFKEIDKFIYRDKKYVINKQLFKLYWCLESLKLFVNDINPDELLRISERAIQEKEYTIREKVAEILVLTDNKIFEPLLSKLKQDENYYVRAVFKKNT